MATSVFNARDLPEPNKLESCHLKNKETGKASGSAIPEKVSPNSIEVVDCSSTLIIRSTKLSSEPETISGTMAEKN